MAVERTLSIIKPDAVAKNVIGEIYARFERTGSRSSLRGCAAVPRRCRRFLRRAPRTAVFQGPGRFHDVGPGHDPGARRRKRHREEPRADGRHRPEEGGAGHDPRRFRASIDANAVHGSDGPETAQGRDRLLLPGAQRSTRAEAPRGARIDDDQPARPRRRGTGSALRRAAARSRFARSRCSRWLHQRFVGDVAAMTDLAKALRARLAADAEIRGAAGDPRHDRRRRHAQVAARRRQRQRDRVRLHPGGRPRHAVRLVAGRAARSTARSARPASRGSTATSRRRDRRPALAREPHAARRRRQRRRGSSRAARRSPTS